MQPWYFVDCGVISIKLLIVFGTRPEAIKMGPLVLELKKDPFFDTVLCTTGQHKEMLEPILALFQIVPDYHLSIMLPNQTLFDIGSRTTDQLRPIIEKEKPDAILVHGDTTTAFATALTAYYLGIPVVHIEAGLRTFDSYSPYPEEFNRAAIDKIASLCFAPTGKAKENLLSEGKKEQQCFIVGNTVIDALKYTTQNDIPLPLPETAQGKKLITLTAHRRESFDKGLEQIFRAIVELTEKFEDIFVVYPVHKNPVVQEQAKKYLSGKERILLLDPMDIVEFHALMKHSYLTLTDSGGIQEEAPSLGCPVVVLRDKTERTEAVEAGTVVLAGTETERIVKTVSEILSDQNIHGKMKNAVNPYGDGTAARKIVQILKNKDWRKNE